jgi:hypothetical protein
VRGAFCNRFESFQPYWAANEVKHPVPASRCCVTLASGHG